MKITNNDIDDQENQSDQSIESNFKSNEYNLNMQLIDTNNLLDSDNPGQLTFTNQDLSFNQNQSPDSSKMDLVLNLKWGLRDETINIINKFSSLLSGKSFSIEDKKRLVKENTRLIQKLTILSIGDGENELRKNLELIDQSLIKSVLTKDIFLEIHQSTRDVVVSLLMRNYSYAILYNHVLSKEIVNCLAKENNEIVFLLLGLQQSTVRCSSDIEDDEVLETNRPDVNKKDVRIVIYEKDEEQNNQQLNNKVPFKEIDLKRKETTFGFNIKKKLIKPNKKIKSKTFSCAFIPWNLMVKFDREQVGLFLISPLKSNCYMELEFELKILAQNHLVSKKFSFSYGKLFEYSDSFAFGTRNFISYEDLADLIENGRIKVEVHLVISKLHQEIDI